MSVLFLLAGPLLGPPPARYMTLLDLFAARRELCLATAASCSLNRRWACASLSLGGASRVGAGESDAAMTPGTTRLICGESRRCAEELELLRDTCSMAFATTDSTCCERRGGKKSYYGCSRSPPNLTTVACFCRRKGNRSMVLSPRYQISAIVAALRQDAGPPSRRPRPPPPLAAPPPTPAAPVPAAAAASAAICRWRRARRPAALPALARLLASWLLLPVRRREARRPRGRCPETTSWSAGCGGCSGGSDRLRLWHGKI